MMTWSGDGVRTIGEVLDALDGVVARSLEQPSRLGYFAVVYRSVTKVAEGIATLVFEDGERMERLDVAFASRYLSALALHEEGRRPTRSWEVAFDTAASARPIVLQHLLVGINAHINLDLGIAAAETAPGASLPELRRDFDRINETLALVMARVERDLARSRRGSGSSATSAAATTTRSCASASRSRGARRGASPWSARRSGARTGAVPSAHATPVWPGSPRRS